jgi:UDP-N-acetylglucosamine--N-acetylmuramyl-(pentapeptide) pyrophosphoryl-undecaprenol N-acetylglucosamine transferase
VPVPYAADDHQLRNAEAFARTGAGIVVRDQDFTGERLYAEVTALIENPGRLRSMAAAAREFARPNAAARAAEAIEEVAGVR